jgi:hypothetical protein
MKTYMKFFIVIAIFVAGCFMISCSQDDDTIGLKTIENEGYLSLSVSNFDFSRDWNNLSETDKNIFKAAKKRMNITFEKNGICRTKWTSSDQINISDELFDCFINKIAVSNRATEELNMIKITTFVRLKSGNESDRTDNCVVQSLYYVLQSFGISYSLSDIDNWIYTNNYYDYSAQYGWGAVYAPVLSHYLDEGGGVVNRTQTEYNAALNNLSTPNNHNQYIIVLSGQPLHTVVASSYNPPFVTYYDPQNSCSGQCTLSDIIYMYEAMPF